VFKIKPDFIRLNETNRLYKISKPLIGLTGGVATGKSTVTHKLIQMGFPIINADKLVHQIYAKESSLEFIKDHFPSAITGAKINFPTLRKIFFDNTNAQKKIENFIYAQLENEFLKKAEELNQHNFLIYDVPLLFEKGLNQLVDQSICVYTDQNTQIARMIKRDNIDETLAHKMIKAQIDIERKRDLSDWVIENNTSLADLDGQLDRFLGHYFTK